MRSEIAAKAAEIYASLKHDPKFTLDLADDELHQWLIQHPEVVDMLKIAHDAIKAEDERNRFKPPEEKQLVLWPDEALEDTIPNGQPRGRVTMGNADSSHLDAWDEVDKENLFNVLTAFENGRSLRINLKKELRPDETVRQCRDRMRAEAKRKKPKG